MRDGTGMQIVMVSQNEVENIMSCRERNGTPGRILSAPEDHRFKVGEEIVLDPGRGMASLLLARVSHVHDACAPRCVYVDIIGPVIDDQAKKEAGLR